MQDPFLPGSFNVNAAFFMTLVCFQMDSEGDIQKVLNIPSQEMLIDKKKSVQVVWYLHFSITHPRTFFRTDLRLWSLHCTGNKVYRDCFTVSRRWIRHLLSLPSWYGLKVDSVKVCGWVFVCMPVPVIFCSCMWVSCYSCTMCIYYTSMQNPVCLYKHSWPHQIVTHMDPITVMQT